MSLRRTKPVFSVFLIALSLIFAASAGGEIPVSLSDAVLQAMDSKLHPYVKYQAPEFLTYEELRQLSKSPDAFGDLKAKLDKFWVTPIISNEAHYAGAKPLRPKTPLLGPFLRVASWNIEKSLNMDRAIRLFTATESEFLKMLDFVEIHPESPEHHEIKRQWERLRQSDVILLQEMEIGVKRSGYMNAAAELAKALGMNYVYAPQYLEVDPVILGIETLEFEEGGLDQEAMDFYSVDPAQYKGVFGSAVLSRYPIRHAEVRPLNTQGYDWYWGEKEKVTFLETVRRFGAKSAFKNEITREMKVGGRHYFRVDLDIPEVEGGTLTIINIHLEIKCQPKVREKQILEILAHIKDIRNPLIMMGDYNAAPTDISPTSLTRVATRTAKNPTTWLSVAVNAISPHGMALNTTRGVSNVTKNFNDPFAADVKVIAPNPLKGMFQAIREFRFDDGRTFDFRGDPARSIGNKDDLLANSNQRGLKGFKTTFSVKRPWGIVGKYRLDWVFVKHHLFDPEDENAAFKFSPHFGETLEELNTGLRDQISDHHPNLIDLPFEEPRI